MHLHIHISPGVGECADFVVVGRDEWGARPAARASPSDSLVRPATMALIHHTIGGYCDTDSKCIGEVKAVQAAHMDQNSQYLSSGIDKCKYIKNCDGGIY